MRICVAFLYEHAGAGANKENQANDPRYEIMKLRPNLNSISSRLILFGLVIVIASSMARVLVLSNYLRKDLSALASSQLLSLANYVAHDIDLNIEKRRILLERMASKFPVALLRDPHRLQMWLGERQEINPEFSLGLSVLDTSGAVFAGYSNPDGRAGSVFAASDYFQQATNGQFFIGRPIIGAVSKKPLLPMAMPVRDSAGKIRAVLVGDTALDAVGFLENLQHIRAGKGAGWCSFLRATN